MPQNNDDNDFDHDDDVDPRKALTCARISQLGRLESESTGA